MDNTDLLAKWFAPPPNADIFLIGIGQDWRTQMSLGALAALRRCREVFYFSELEGFSTFLNELGTVGHDLSRSARFGELRSTLYKECAKTILSAAGVGVSVAWVTQGNPALLCGVSREILRDSLDAKLNVAVLPGPSSIDSVLCDIRSSDHFIGLQVLDASQVLLHELPINRSLHCLILQMSRAETLLNPLAAPLRPLALERLQRHLDSFYPGCQKCYLVTSAREERVPATVVDATVGRLRSFVSEVSPWTSLFIPGSLELLPTNNVVASLLADYDHLEKLYLTPLQEWTDTLPQSDRPTAVA